MSTNSVTNKSTPTGLETPTAVVSVLSAMAGHLDLYDLPVGYEIEASKRGAEIILKAESPGALATELIAWANTLTAVTSEARRLEQSDGVLLSVKGRLPEGVPVRAFGVADYAEYARTARAEMEPGHRMSLSMDALRDISDIPGARP